MATLEETTEVLGDLIDFPNISSNSNLEIIDYIAERPVHFAFTHDEETGASGRRHSMSGCKNAKSVLRWQSLANQP
jgi:hypothetical protein